LSLSSSGLFEHVEALTLFEVASVELLHGNTNIDYLYTQLIVEITCTQNVSPHSLVGRKGIYPDGFTHLQELATKDRIAADLFLVRDSEVFQMFFELI